MSLCSSTGRRPPSLIHYCSTLPSTTPQPSATHNQRNSPPSIPTTSTNINMDLSPSIDTPTITSEQPTKGRSYANIILGKSPILQPCTKSLAREPLCTTKRVRFQPTQQLHDARTGESSTIHKSPPRQETSTNYQPPPKQEASNWFLKTIRQILTTEIPDITKPTFQFEPTTAAAANNMNIIKSAGGVEEAIQQQKNTPVSYGSEFRPTWLLRILMHRHPLWHKTEQRITNGTSFPLLPIDDNLRERDLKATLAYGNHKSTYDSDTFTKAMEKEIKHGFALPLPIDFAIMLPHAEAAPHGIISQNSINEFGEIIDKERVTHDQSYTGAASNESVNSRVIDEDLVPCYFGHMSRRCIHYIIGCRQRHPSTTIWISKIDWKSAYRRQHFHSSTATKSLTQVVINGVLFLLMALRLTFGGKACPSEWGCISEPTADLATDILNCAEWDPKEIHSPLQSKMPQKKTLHPSIPFAQARETIVDIPAEDKGKCDVYLDDTTAIGPDIGNNASRLEACILLAFYIICRPLAPNEPIPRDDAVAEAKLLAEGGIEEVKTLLGWVFDSRRLLISLPDDKCHSWTADILDILISSEATYQELDTIIGRLNHVGYIIPTARHFLSRIRKLKMKAKFKRKVSIPAQVHADFNLWCGFLKKANKGMSMNLLTYRRPTHIYRSDACEHGLGGFSAKGRAWRWTIPTHLLSRAHINLLEFLASIICIWVDAIEGVIKPEDCLLSLGDNTSATGWLRRSNFLEEGEEDHDTTVKLLAARHLASTIQQTDSCLYSQWFPGKDNDISDSLSRDTHLSDKHLTNLLNKCVPHQIPPNFRISPLPSEIVCWVSCLLAKLPVNKQRQVQHKMSVHARGEDGRVFSQQWKSDKTHSSTTLSPGPAPFSSVPSPKPCGKPVSLNDMSTPWLKAQSEPPLITWHRPSGLITGQIHEQMTEDDCLTFFSNNTAATRI